MSRRSWRSPAWRWGALGVGGALGWSLLMMPMTTRQGVDFAVSEHRIPLYLKGLSFLDRHYQSRDLARQVTSGVSSDRDRVLTIFAWTRRSIRPTPPQLPVVDDHIWHIIVRGYGEDDQMADVFTTLATYAGVPAFWDVAKIEDQGRLVLSFAKVDDRWAMFDVAHGLVFADAGGRFFEVQELLARPELVDAVAGALATSGIPYRTYLAQLGSFQVPAMLRAHKQMPLRRLGYEAKLRLHLLEDAEARAASRPSPSAGGER
ncbi:MAG: transglutaminase domain-containing protein [Candidatus Omnitrophica bacterium]|nr:transglutaminase domain-containing protein [Candidatus Omnitrophota bacterium]